MLTIKANKHMGPDSANQYPSVDLLPYMSIRDAQGGGKALPLEPKVGGGWLSSPHRPPWLGTLRPPCLSSPAGSGR